MVLDSTIHLATTLVIAVFPIVTVFAAATDFFTMTISNRLTIGLFAAGCVALALTAPGWTTAGLSLAAAGVVLACGFALFALGWMGGGDVKLATAIALWLGWDHLVDFVLSFSIWGGLLTVAVLAIDRLLTPLPSLRVGFLVDFPEHRHVPYGLALTAAALQIFPTTHWLAHVTGG